MKIALLICVSAVLLLGCKAQEDCPLVCPQLWGPVCATNSQGHSQTFDNECILRAKNCAQKTDYVKQRDGEC